ncbi:Hypothetical protein R9X50_00009800 [Acrodontium crateriforme]|uniref:Integral membrane protein-like protein n=1 Tax=Acrodontium crateriforme TaxID=150365 RepID=A0AAQ3LWU8_9PEZI|nr:Hypothetical protein R9X50_00009800 [Acrodontium crateriforme]
MRFLAIFPALLCAVSLILAFLCLFSGHGTHSFMEDYAIVTLNTSRLGENVFNTSSSSSSNPFTAFLHNVTSTIENDIEDGLNSLAKDLGIHDFYSVHILDFCEGYYTPGAVPNATLSKSAISKNVTKCSNATAIYNFNPHQTLQQELDNSGHSNINITALGWPNEIDTAIRDLRVAAKAMFVLYCIGIALVFIAFSFAALGICFDGRLNASVNILVDWLAFVTLGIASAIATAIAVKASDVINDHGSEAGLHADKGTKFMILTWVATGLMFVTSLIWCFVCVKGRKRTSSKKLSD